MHVVMAKGPGPRAQGPRRRYACEELPDSIYENDQTASIKSHKFLASIKNVPKTWEENEEKEKGDAAYCFYTRWLEQVIGPLFCVIAPLCL